MLVPKTGTSLVLRLQEASQTELEETIRSRAYQLYESRGREDGHDLDDWLQAEAELRLAGSRNIAA